MADRDAPARPTALETGQPADPPAGAGGFVREATGDDLEAIGRVHAASMLASLRVAHAAAHDGAPLPAGVVAMIAAPVLAAGWERAVLAPPSPRHRVLVATEDGEVVGLLGLAPTRGLAQGDPGAEPESAVEITALGVDPTRQRSGHGSRLLAAAADHARADGARVLLVWAVRGDESVRGLLAGAGLERTPSRRELPVGRGVTEECWGAAL
jgi:GNAT superfamily N-acetyltransferase